MVARFRVAVGVVGGCVGGSAGGGACLFILSSGYGCLCPGIGMFVTWHWQKQHGPHGHSVLSWQ